MCVDQNHYFFSNSKEKTHHAHTHAAHTDAHTHMMHAHSTPCTHPCSRTHPCTHTCTPMHTTLTHTTHTPHMQVHTHAHTRHAHTTHTNSTKKLRVKEGNQFKSSFFGARVVVSTKHISSTPKESPAPRWSCRLVELLLQSWFGGAGALPNTP
jgi:hypothetical protein